MLFTLLTLRTTSNVWIVYVDAKLTHLTVDSALCPQVSCALVNHGFRRGDHGLRRRTLLGDVLLLPE